MATTLTSCRVATSPGRLELRARYGDIESMFQCAKEEQAAGNLRNAKEILRAILTLWLRQKWIEISGKHGTPLLDPVAFAKKLKSGCHIDAWTHRLIIIAAQAPSHCDRWLHVDLLMGVVSAIFFGHLTTLSSRQSQRNKTLKAKRGTPCKI